VELSVARRLRAGHPWVFRDVLGRSLEGQSPGAVVPVSDEEGYPIGAAMYDPDAGVALRMVSDDPEFAWSAEEVARRVEVALAYRQRRGDEGFSRSMRLIHGEADGFPGVAVDRLGDYLLIYQYARCAEVVVDALTNALAEAVDVQGIYVQDRMRPVTAEDRRPPARLVHGKAAPPDITVDEDGLQFLVDVTAPVSPGLFLDLREGRRWFEGMTEGARVLNLFSFTGAFGLRAVRGGASEVVNVDAAARSHARCRQNLAATGLDPEACEALTGDVFKFLERFRQRKRTFDLVVVDPPPFSNVRGAVFSALKDWSQLAEAITPVVAPGGRVLAISNASRLTDDDFLFALGEGALRAHRSARFVGECGLPVDFPVLPAFTEGRYLKVKLLDIA